jgi:hypothetical protein
VGEREVGKLKFDDGLGASCKVAGKVMGRRRDVEGEVMGRRVRNGRGGVRDVSWRRIIGWCRVKVDGSTGTGGGRGGGAGPNGSGGSALVVRREIGRVSGGRVSRRGARGAGRRSTRPCFG